MKYTSLFCIVFAGLAGKAMSQVDWCIPQVDVAASAASGITNVSLNGAPAIDRTSSPTEGYVHASNTTTLMVGAFYTLNIDKDSGVDCGDNNIRAYIDFNLDHVFNESTETVALLNYAGDGTDDFTFIVPYTAVQGETRLRVCEKMSTDCGMVPINACGTGDTLSYRGEIEDYTITISGHVGIGGMAIDASTVNVTAVNGSLMMDASLNEGSLVTVELMDASGRAIYAKDFGRLPPGQHRMQLDASPFRGLCIARATINGQPVVTRFMRE